jgi:hypothetical protein
MNTQQLAELERALNIHLELLTDYLVREDVVESSCYLPIAGQLRVLLCDAQVPILLTYAGAKGFPLYVWGPRPLSEMLKEQLAWMMNLQLASWVPYEPRSYRYTIQDFLDLPIGREIVATGSSCNEGKDYTPRQLIKWIANKEGVCHECH